ncbi:MAG: oxidoreductase [Verrucomicrobia bacterium RIFCSPLOWO2_12_FULL_64_8]|nr:MAG: oxidoreductase [Verrucomicrobia bacterium RIFCSPLOWO2_12_FULL_64_8]
MKTVRLGIVGLGNMGSTHARSILEGRIQRLELAAVADSSPDRLALLPRVQGFRDADRLIASRLADAVLVATPHFDHASTGIKALKAGLHVMIEKPISVHKADAQLLLAAHRGRKGQIFAAMFNQRTDSCFRKIRELVRGGELGKIRRVNWIITNWFRTEAYYASGSWRATWAGEGGGVLLNQCPHNLDLLQWMFGMPRRVRAFCGFGRYHHIEVEDDVTAYLEFPNGANAVFITTTGEAPGTSHLEIAAENGRLVYENDQITYTRNDVPMSVFNRTSEELFGRPPTREIPVPTEGHGGQHNEILQNFTDAILDGKPLIAPAAEGIHSVELANAMLLSAWTGKTVELPLNGRLYERLLRKKITDSRFKKKKVRAGVAADFAKSFGR